MDSQTYLNEMQGFFSTGLGVTTLVISLVLYVLWIVAMWKVFSKAGYWGILSIIPIVNIFILVKVGGMSAWLTLLYLIPVVGLIFSIVVAVKVGANFGRGGFFSFIWLWLIPFIGYYIIGYGAAQYRRA